MHSKNLSHFILISSVILIFGFFTGCSPRTETPPAESSPSAVVVEETATPTPPAETPEIWLIAGPEVDVMLRQQYSEWLGGRAEQNGTKFVTYETFVSSAVPSKLEAAVFLSNFEEISNLAANMPDTQFVAITQTDIQPSENLSIIQESSDKVLFMAGYLSILNAPDFRAGALLVDNGSGNVQQQAFMNGGRYFCGRCSPVFGPIVTFPQVILVAAGSDAAGWQSAFDTLNQNRIEMVYIPAEAILPPFLDHLAAQGVGVISNAPPRIGYENLWVATVTSNPFSTFESLWPQIAAGTGGHALQADISLTNVNAERLSLGRQQLAERLIPSLMSEAIEPLDLP